VLGRNHPAADAAVEFCGAGRRLDSYADLQSAAIVLLSVGDQDLASTVGSAADAGALRPDSLWLHCSGGHGLEVLAPLHGRTAGLAAMHPLCPVPDREIGYRNLDGKVALIETTAEHRSTLDQLAQHCGLFPVHISRPIDRAFYHAACSLAANGLTSLVDLLRELFGSICGLEPEQIDPMLSGLMKGSLAACNEIGPVAALSGPVARGDHGALAEHMAALSGSPGRVVYRSLMMHAIGMALRAGHIDEAVAGSLERVLNRSDEGTVDG
jgi:predicted short-subunit dehydrogenase-like oxidoreductase (DUF2520 family)